MSYAIFLLQIQFSPKSYAIITKNVIIILHVNTNIKRYMKKAKENWIEEECRRIEENLKNNSKRAYQLVKDCTSSLRKMPHRRTRDTEPMDRILL